MDLLVKKITQVGRLPSSRFPVPFSQGHHTQGSECHLEMKSFPSTAKGKQVSQTLLISGEPRELRGSDLLC